MYYIVRHGQTEKNRQKLLQGRSDLPLNDAGRMQAEELSMFFEKEGIRFETVYSSPLSRAVETASIACMNRNEIVADERLLEMDYGPYEGLDLSNPPSEIKRFFSDFVHEPAPAGMESLASVVSRMGEFLEEIKGRNKGNVLISCHAISMKGALEYLSPEAKGMYWSKYIGNCAVYCFEETEQGYTVPFELDVKKE